MATYTSGTFSTNNQYIKYRIVVTENSVDIPNNTSNITVKVQAWRTNDYTTDDDGTCYCSIDGHNYSASWTYGQKPIRYYNYQTLFTKTLDIEHDADGSKRIYVSAYIRHDRFSSNSQGFNVDLEKIPRQATIISAANFNDDQNPVLGYSNPAGDIVDSLQAALALSDAEPISTIVPFRDIPKTGASYTFELTAANRAALLAATPNSNTLTVYYVVKTVISGVTYYSTQAASMAVVNAAPTISGVDYADVNSTTLAITNDPSQIIQNHSTALFTIGAMAAIKSATLSRVDITINAVNYTASLSGASQSNVSVPIGAINSASNLTAVLVVTDSRGNTTTATKNITVLGWSVPNAIINCNRRNNYYAETDLNVDANYSSLDGKNAVTITYQYKETTSSTWSSPATMADGATVTLTLDQTKQWNVKVIVSDLIGSATYNLTLDRGIPITFFDRLRRSIGFNAFPTSDETVENHGTVKNDGEYISSKSGVGYQANNGAVNTETGYQATRSDTNTSVYFGVGSDGIIHGLFSRLLNKWLIYGNAATVHVNGTAENVTGTVGVANGGTGGTTAETARSGLGIACTEIYGAITSGTVSFSVAGYKALVFIGRGGGSTPNQTLYIPLSYLSTSEEAFSFTHGYQSQYTYFYISVNNGTASVRFGGGQGRIQKVYGVN